MRFTIAALVTSAVMLSGCQQMSQQEVKETQSASAHSVSIPYEKYTLDNGLTVILHEDHSDPIVHVDVTYHVGSAREELGKSGFAHFFEHMMFQGSQHVEDEEHFKIVTEAGGNMNGTTNTDRTNYFQTVPANQLEKILWLESDRMGFLLPAVTEEKFEVQRETVKNERGQRVDNQPYGLRHERTGEALYPVGHPYSWTTIGYVEDLDRVNVNDLKAFFKRWYGPNNATLTIGGDIDVKQTKAWVEKYFGEIPRGPEVAEPEPQMVTLEEDRYITLEDNVHLPLLQITFPTVYARHPDEAPLDVLSDILGGGKTSLLYKNMVKGGDAVQAGVSHPCRELACQFQLIALANPAKVTDLATLKASMDASLKEFETRGVTEDDLARTKASIESSTVFGLQSVSGKVSTLAHNQVFEGEPDIVAENIARYNAVTPEDVMRVYNKYIKNGHGVVLSIVPKGQSAIAAAPQNFTLPARNIEIETVDGDVKTPALDSEFDRSIHPKAGPAPVVLVPEFWKSEVKPGIPMIGVTSHETPTVSLSLSMEGGPLLESKEKAGTAVMMAALLNETTQHYSNEEMANEMAKLGSSIRISAGGRYTRVSLSSLSKNFPATLKLLEEKMFNPAFLQADFDRLKARMLQSIQQSSKNPSALAGRAESVVLYGDEQRLSLPDSGTIETLTTLTLDDVKAFYASYFNPSKAQIVMVGDLTQAETESSLSFLADWAGEDYAIPDYAPFPEHKSQHIYLIDKPDAPQSVVTIVKHSLPYDATGKQFRARLMNFPLGGAFNSRINLNLREDKGYTYGARSGFNGGKTLGSFDAGADVTASSTGASITEFLKEINQYRDNGVTESELSFMRSAYTLSEALKYETPSSKGRFLSRLLQYNLPADYRDEQMEIIKTISQEEINGLAKEMLNLDDAQIIVVGDKASLMPQLSELDIPIIDMSVSF